MLSDYLIYPGAALTIAWGIYHVFPTKKLRDAIERKNWESREILFMEWVLEGITLIFIGSLVLAVYQSSGGTDETRHIVFRASAAMLAVMATWTLITGAITSFKPLQVCPFVKLVGGALIFFGSYLQ
ncbi:MAG TPA: hypothetical protein PKG48_13570 [Bacteroidales bacterium]|nr:hypothetical protein [Bacteroidales bacterium]HPS63420.1 hypothetical protein [Bacteroidales bacterium]